MTLLSPPEPVLTIARTLESAGFETWCVGGAVRDALLGEAHLDWDLATAATPKDVRQLFRRTVPVGIDFGTVGVLDPSGVMHEVTTFRKDVRTDGRHAEVEFGVSLDEDLARRDFTINAIAYSPSRDELRDPFGGRRDLEGKVVRAVGTPDERMREDRLRALRALRFAGRFGFAVDPATWKAIVDSVPYLGRLSMERVKQELEKTMDQVARPSAPLRLWRDSGAFAALIPALAAVADVTLAAVDRLPRPSLARRPQRRINRLTALFVGLGGDTAERALRSLRFSNADAGWIGVLAGRWAAVQVEMERALSDAGTIGDAQIRRWAATVGRTRLGPLLRVADAIWGARAESGEFPRAAWLRVGALYRRAIRIAYRDPIEVADLAVDGGDLLTAGVPSGPQVGRALHSLLQQVLADPALNTREQLLARARALVPERR